MPSHKIVMDEAIDAVARDVTAGSPSTSFRAAVSEALAHRPSRTPFTWVWRAAVATTAATAVAALLWNSTAQPDDEASAIADDTVAAGAVEDPAVREPDVRGVVEPQPPVAVHPEALRPAATAAPSEPVPALASVDANPIVIDPLVFEPLGPSAATLAPMAEPTPIALMPLGMEPLSF